MDILDTILESMSNASTPASAVRVLRENNDLNSINWVQGLSDPGEMLKCGYLPELRRLGNESDAAYQERLLRTCPQNIIDLVRDAAIKRAGLDVTNGKVSLMVAGGEDFWHTLGTWVEEATSSTDALTISGQNWTASKVKAQYEFAGQMRTMPGRFIVVRDDTGAPLGDVGDRYTIVQNADCFRLIDKALASFGARYETAGVLHGGRKVWLQAKLPNGFTLPGGDETFARLTLVNSHDGSSAVACYPTNFRAVCANTLRRSLKDKSKGLSFRHTGDVAGKVDDIKRMLGIVVEGFDQAKEEAEVLFRTPLQAGFYFDQLLDNVLDMTAARQALDRATSGADLLNGMVAVEAATKKFEALQEKKDGLLEEMMNAYHSPTCANGQGTAWGAVNAATQVFDHGQLFAPKRGSVADRQSRQFESVIAGAADDAKQTAYQMALGRFAN